MPGAIGGDHDVRQSPCTVRLVLQRVARNAIGPTFDANFIGVDGRREDDEPKGGDRDFRDHCDLLWEFSTLAVMEFAHLLVVQSRAGTWCALEDSSASHLATWPPYMTGDMAGVDCHYFLFYVIRLTYYD